MITGFNELLLLHVVPPPKHNVINWWWCLSFVGWCLMRSHYLWSRLIMYQPCFLFYLDNYAAPLDCLIIKHNDWFPPVSHVKIISINLLSWFWILVIFTVLSFVWFYRMVSRITNEFDCLSHFVYSFKMNL